MSTLLVTVAQDESANASITGVGGIASAEVFGAPVIAASISATGIASAEAFGAPAVAASISASGIASAEAFGSLSVQPVAVVVEEAPAVGISLSGGWAWQHPQAVHAITGVGGIASAEAFGNPTIQFVAIVPADIIPITATVLPLIAVTAPPGATDSWQSESDAQMEFLLVLLAA